METVKQNTDFKLFSLISGLYALFYTFCLYRNYRGITFPFFVIGTACFFLYYIRVSGHTLKKGSGACIAAAFLLGLNVCLTTNVTVIMFDKAFIFLTFFMLFLHNLYDDSAWDVSKYFLSICGFAASAIEYLPRPVSDIAQYLKDRNEDNAMTKSAEALPVTGEGEVAAEHLTISRSKAPIVYVLIGLGVSIPVLAVILPLLITSDVVFSDILRRMFDFDLNFNPVTLFLMVLAAFFAAYMMLCRFREEAAFVSNPVTDKRTLNPIIAITVNVVLLAVYLLYCAIQVVYLFMRKGSLPTGYTYSKYAHEGFFQLVFVCLINIVLVLLCRKYSRDSFILKLILCLISACTYIMIASSAYRMYMYINAYNLTFLRLYVLWALVVMAVIMTGVIAYLFIPRMPFARFAIWTLVCLWIVFAYMRPDFHIAAYDIRYSNDTGYICELSFDAVPAIERYDKSGELLDEYFADGDYAYMETDPLRRESRENKASWRTWNYSLWRAGSVRSRSMIPDRNSKIY